MNLKPLGDRVVVKPDEGEERTASGIVLPDTAKEKPQEGEVVAVGPGRTEDGKVIAPAVKVGDKIIYAEYGPTKVKVKSIDYLILSESNILAVVGK